MDKSSGTHCQGAGHGEDRAGAENSHDEPPGVGPETPDEEQAEDHSDQPGEDEHSVECALQSRRLATQGASLCPARNFGHQPRAMGLRRLHWPAKLHDMARQGSDRRALLLQLADLAAAVRQQLDHVFRLGQQVGARGLAEFEPLTQVGVLGRQCREPLRQPVETQPQLTQFIGDAAVGR